MMIWTGKVRFMHMIFQGFILENVILVAILSATYIPACRKFYRVITLLEVFI